VAAVRGRILTPSLAARCHCRTRTRTRAFIAACCSGLTDHLRGFVHTVCRSAPTKRYPLLLRCSRFGVLLFGEVTHDGHTTPHPDHLPHQEQ
jgi:hypothetical protein